MRLNSNIKSTLIELVFLSYILLFVYAATTKVLDFENFQIQLSQSPVLSAHSYWIARLVPFTELILAGILAIPRFRFKALLCSFSLMTMFTAYIFIVVNFSPYVPCSCGGILEKMSWDMHLIFNLIFMLSAIPVLLCSQKSEVQKNKIFFTVKSIFSTVVLSIAMIIFLYVTSEKVMHSENPFIRRYPPHPAEFSNAVNLKVNSYYFAGFSNNKLYLGNYSVPSQILTLNKNLERQQIEQIQFDPKKIPFKVVTLHVSADYFYLLDGSVPKVFRGKIKNWKINKELNGIDYFTKALPVDSSTVAFRTNKGKKLTNILGIFSSGKNPEIKYKYDLLKSQTDGVFDTDGSLLYSEKLQKIVYLYFYRNEFIVAEKNGMLSYTGNTIDTIKHAKIKVTALKNGKEYAVSSPPFVVNPHAAVYQNLLFVHSAVKGRNENTSLWEKSFIIDIYDINKNIYLFSFPIYQTGSNKLASLLVNDTNLYAIIGNDLVVYELKDIIKKEFKSE